MHTCTPPIFRGWGPPVYVMVTSTFVRVLDPSFPSRGCTMSFLVAVASHSARPVPLAWLGRGKHLRARSVSCSLRNICNGCWTRVLIHGSTTPSSVSGSLVTPPDAGGPPAVTPERSRTTLGGCPTRRRHVWCFPFTSKCQHLIRVPDPMTFRECQLYPSSRNHFCPSSRNHFQIGSQIHHWGCTAT